MKTIEYDRDKVYNYAKKWAYARNPQYYNFDELGGDCTNFVSQCIYSGVNTMNYKKDLGWYYIDGNHKSPSWTGVEYLYNFLLNNDSIGPYGEETNRENLEIGDIVQLSFDGRKYEHTTIIVNLNNILMNNIYVASHTYDVFNKAINLYKYQKIRFIHIVGCRIW